MSLANQLKDLTKKRDAELQTLHFTYLRTKRDAHRTLSPDRIIRKHLAPSLGLAAIAGLLLAPRPSRPKPTELQRQAVDQARARGVAAPHESLLTHLRQLLTNIFAQLEQATAPKPSPQSPHSNGKSHTPASQSKTLLATLLGTLLAHLDVAKIISLFIPRSHHNGHSPPNITPANTGTVEPDPLHDFQ